MNFLSKRAGLVETVQVCDTLSLRQEVVNHSVCRMFRSVLYVMAIYRPQTYSWFKIQA